MVFQSLALFPHRTVGQNVEFPMKIKGIPAPERKEKALELLEMFRLPADYYHKGIGQCSGGEKQRIALARALAFDPEIIFFDEPLSALDYRLRKTLEKELKALHNRTGKTFIYITHSLEEAMVMSDRIAILRAGKFEQIGPAAEIYNKPKSSFVAGFMGDVNLFDVQLSGTEPPIAISSFTISKSFEENIKIDAGKKNLLMVRPESINLLGEDEPADFTAVGKVMARFLLGSRIQYEIELPDEKMVIVEAAGNGLQKSQGDQVRLGFSWQQAHLIEEDWE